MTAGFKLLLETPANTPKNSQELPALEATIQGLQLLLQEKDQRIQDLKKENERLDFYALYFKSQDYKRLETSTREVKPEVQDYSEKPARTPRRGTEKEIIKKACRYCGAEFETDNPRREYCEPKHRTAYNREQKELKE